MVRDIEKELADLREAVEAEKKLDISVFGAEVRKLKVMEFPFKFNHMDSLVKALYRDHGRDELKSEHGNELKFKNRADSWTRVKRKGS